MSSYLNETMTFTRNDLNRINNALRNAQAAQRENDALQRRLAELRQQQESDRQAALAQLTAQREQLDTANRTIRELDAGIRERERMQNERIQAMQQQFNTELQSMEQTHRAEQESLRSQINHTRSEMQAGLNQLRSDTSHALAEQRAYTDREIQRLGSELSEDIRNVDQRITSLANNLAAQKQGEMDLASYWAQEAARLLTVLAALPHSQLLDPGKLRDLQNSIEGANDSLRSGQYQASIVFGRQAFFNALDMKDDYARAELEWNAALEALRIRETDLNQALNNANQRTFEYEGTTYDEGIDYWTGNQLSIVRSQIQQMNEAAQNVDSLTLQQLQAMEEQFHALQEQLALVENAAHINVAMSISRRRIVTEVQAILGASYNMTDSDGDFFGRENNDEYHAVFVNPTTGDCATLTISPVMDENTGVVQNHIDLLVDTMDNRAANRRRISDNIAENLRSAGLENCKFPCSERHGSNVGQEIDRVGNIEDVVEGRESARAAKPEACAVNNTGASVIGQQAATQEMRDRVGVTNGRNN